MRSVLMVYVPLGGSGMSDETRLSHGVMEGDGAYNKYAKLPAGGAALALPFLEKAIRGLRLDPGDQPIVIADYGSSQGKNSLAPLRIAIKALRSRLVPEYQCLKTVHGPITSEMATRRP